MAKRILRFSFLIWLLAAGAKIQAQSLTIGCSNCLAVANYSPSLMNQLGQAKWYLAHASVGECIMEGVTNLHLANPGLCQLHGANANNVPPGSTATGVIYHSQGNQLTVSYNGSQVASAADAEASPYSNGAIGFDMFTSSTPFAFALENVTVTQ
jgi:hypothetical protein